MLYTTLKIILFLSGCPLFFPQYYLCSMYFRKLNYLIHEDKSFLHLFRHLIRVIGFYNFLHRGLAYLKSLLLSTSQFYCSYKWPISFMFFRWSLLVQRNLIDSKKLILYPASLLNFLICFLPDLLRYLYIMLLLVFYNILPQFLLKEK